MAERFRKLPVEIEAMQYTDAASFVPLSDWASWDNIAIHHEEGVGDVIEIRTLEGVMRADPGDWIIKGVAGEFYPCKPDVFAQLYEAVDG